MAKTKVINLFGGPGTGKTTTALELSFKLKAKHVNCELVTEYVKDWVWEGRKINPYDQVYLLAKQSRKQQILYGAVDVIITDAPLWLFPIYENSLGHPPYICKQIVDKFAEEAEKQSGVEFIHVFLNRKHAYNPKGRHQTESEAIHIDGLLKKFLEDNNMPHHVFDSVEGVGDEIIKQFNLLDSVIVWK